MSRVSNTIVLGLLIAVMGVVGSFIDFAHELEEDVGLAMLFRLRGVKAPPPDVVLISIDRESSKHLGVDENPDRWSRSLHARLIEKLAEEGAKVITFDVYFIDPRSSEEDNRLAEAIRKAGNVILAEQLKAKDISATRDSLISTKEHRIVETLKPISAISRYAVATAPFVLPKLPVKVNRYWTFQAAAGDSPTFPIVAFQLYALSAYDEFFRLLESVDAVAARKLPRDGAAALAAPGTIRFIRQIRSILEGDASIATRMIAALKRSDLALRDPAQYNLVESLINMYGGVDHRYLNYYGPPRTLSTVPFYQVLQSGEVSRHENPIDFKGKAVFVGFSEIELTERRDSFYTVFSLPDGVFLSGAEIAATAFSNLLQNTPVTPIRPQIRIGALVLWGFLVAAIGRSASTARAGLGIIGVSIIYLIVIVYQFKSDGTWYPVIIPLLIQSPFAFVGAVLWNYFESNKERQNIRKALSYYVPDEVVDHLAENIADMRRDDQTFYGPCLFTDCAGYTTVSESMSARQLSDFMHRYFATIFAPIKQNAGLVVDLKGDAVVAVWRGAQSDAALRRQACHAALEVGKAVRRFNDSLDNFKLPTRIGIHAGEIFLGNIGAADHYQYGVTGDTVNTASRMDGLNKYLGTEILVSEEVIAQVEGFLTREAGTFLLKGKAQPIRVYQLLSRAEEADVTQQEACAIFAEGLRAFRCRSWFQAREKFQQSVDLLRDDGLARFYLALCERYEKQSPDETWKGFIELEEK
jgi:adenylate cyclase